MRALVIVLPLVLAGACAPPEPAPDLPGWGESQRLAAASSFGTPSPSSSMFASRNIASGIPRDAATPSQCAASAASPLSR